MPQASRQLYVIDARAQQRQQHADQKRLVGGGEWSQPEHDNGNDQEVEHDRLTDEANILCCARDPREWYAEKSGLARIV